MAANYFKGPDRFPLPVIKRRQLDLVGAVALQEQKIAILIEEERFLFLMS